MKRRNFLRNVALASATLTTLGEAVSCNQAPDSAREKADKSPASSPGDAFELNEVTIGTLQDKMSRGEYTSRSITQKYLDRIAALDKKGPTVNSVIELNPDALAIADSLDAERKSGKVRGPLHGIPVLIKDNINSGDKMMTTAGALALVGNIASKDAFIISRLREAGAVLLGKTNLSEWANFRSTRSCSGWTSRGGQTKNPIVLDRSPCGSSSGSGAAVAANFCTVAIGTETDGSVIAPSSFCGIVGMKPTVGLLSRSGIIPISKTQDTAGPMARTVRDAAILLGALTGIDSEDPVTLNSKGKVPADYTTFLDAGGLKGKRIGIEKSFLKGHEGVVWLFQNAMEVLKKLGATLVEVELIKDTSKLGDAELTVMKYEFKDGVNRYLAHSNAKVKSLADVIAFNNAHEAEAMPFFKQELLVSSNEKGGLDSKEYTEALSKTLGSRKLIDDLMKSQKLDAICGTSIGLPDCIDLVNGDYDTGFYFCPPAAMAGYPHITVPMGAVHDLPVGLSFISTAYDEGNLLKFAYAYEQESRKRTPPKFIPAITG
ncbi:MAG: amidase [Bacteroidota bacterium]|nr:amidase [Bacteroidota bacterium]